MESLPFEEKHIIIYWNCQYNGLLSNDFHKWKELLTKVKICAIFLVIGDKGGIDGP